MSNTKITQLTTRDELTRIDFNDVMAIVADGNYVTIKLRSGRSINLLSGLHDIEKVATKTCHTLTRVGRSHIVNTVFIAVINAVKQTITVADDASKTTFDLHVSKEAVLEFKRQMESIGGEPIQEFMPSNSHMSAKVIENP